MEKFAKLTALISILEQKKSPVLSRRFLINGARGKIRTPDPLVRSQVLYPAELPARMKRLFNRAGR